MGLSEKASDFYRRANESFGRHGIPWTIVTLVLPVVSLGALAAYLAATLDWFWHAWGLLGIFFVVLLTWILLGLGLLIVRSLFNPSWLRAKPKPLKSETVLTPQFDWQMPVETMIAFDSELHAKIWEVYSQLEEATQAAQVALRKLPEAETYGYQIARLSVGDNSSPERRAYDDAEGRRKALEQTFNSLQRSQRENFVKALEKGEYVAQGFLQPLVHGALPLNIPKEEWRLLTFDWGDNTMQRAKIQGGAEYRAVRIAKNPL